MEKVHSENASLINLGSSSAEEIINVLNDYLFEELTPQDISIICNMLVHEDKGVRNAASSIMTINQSVIIPDCVVRLVSSEDIGIRNLAGEILLKNGEKSTEPMLKRLTDANNDDKKFIIDILGLIGDKKAVQPILETLKNNDHPNVILACIEALGNIGEPVDDDIILGFYNKNEVYKPTVIEALGKIGSGKALDFITCNYPEEDILTQYSMIECLGRIGSEETITFLLSSLENSPESLYPALIFALNMLRTRTGADIEITDYVIKGVIETFEHGSIEEIYSALEITRGEDDSRVIGVFLRGLGKDPELDMRIKEIVEIDPVKTLVEISALIDQRKDQAGNYLNLVMSLLIENGLDINAIFDASQKDTFVAAISGLVASPDEEMRKSAMELLFASDAETAFAHLDCFLAEDNLWNKLKLIELLESSENEKALDALKVLTEDEEVMIKQKAGMAISNLNYTKN